MKFADKGPEGSANGIASLAIIKMLIEILQKKDILTNDEIDIILSCAAVEVDNAEGFDRIAEAKVIIENLFQDAEYRVPTGPRY